ncbi:hypothetical protein LCM19_03370 [Qipengyuania flava]|nr:hypothetical protein [Qipengyuania flava]
MKHSILCAPLVLVLAACSQSDAGDDASVPSSEQAPPSAVQTAPPAASDDEQPAPDPGSPKNADDEMADRAPLQDSVPERFRGTYAESIAKCDEPSHGLFTVEAKAIKFFESTGEVRNVRAVGPAAALTVYEQYAEDPGTTYAFYMRLLPDGSLRYRYDDNERMTWVRCP